MKRIPAAVLLLIAALLVPLPAQATPTSSTVLYIAGDSIMASWYLQAKDAFAQRVKYRLCGPYCNTAGYPSVVDVAEGGQRLLDGTAVQDLCGTPVAGQCAPASQWPAILAAHPTTVLVTIGINDMGRVDLNAWADSYRALNQSAADAGIRVVPCTITPLTTWFGAYATEEPEREQANTWLRSFFGIPSVDGCDFDAVLRAAVGPWEQEIYNNGDGIHPSPYGVMQMADVVPLGRLL